MNVPSDWIAFAVALFASLGVTIPVRRLALRTGMVDHPGPRKVHAKPMPLLGGIAIYTGFVVAVVLALHSAPEQQIIGILAGATLVVLVGVLDDGGLLHHQVKLFIGMPVAAALLLVSGIRADFFANFVPGQIGAALDICFTIVWVVGITAAFSILDHMDGLCAGIAAVAAAFFTVAAAISGQTMVTTLGAATLGAALGFLRWNFNPAKIFMGDSGAMLLGFLMATLGLKLRPAGAHFPLTWLAVALILGVPIFDTTLISISRSRRGLLPFTSPGKDHTAHRLSNLGLGHRGAVVALYGLALCSGTLALLVSRIAGVAAYALAAALIVCGLLGIRRLETAPYERQAKLHKPSPAP
jgi:UDP-GlcNAc:undecaprenyl-phosphate/decaprenyl-phosphate GlcNAc-1-phosphate transferase